MMPRRRSMTVDEFLAWVPADQWGRWELVDGFPRWRMRPLQPIDIAATTPEELDRLLKDELLEEGPAT